MRPRSPGSSMVRSRCFAAASSSEVASSTCRTIRRLEIARKATMVSARRNSRRVLLSPRRGRRTGRRVGTPRGAAAELDRRAEAGPPARLGEVCGLRFGQVLLEWERVLRPRLVVGGPGGVPRSPVGVAGGPGPGGGGGSRRPRGGCPAGLRAGPGAHPRPAGGDQVLPGGLEGDAVGRLEPVDVRLEGGVAVLGVAVGTLELGNGEGLLFDVDVEREQPQDACHHDQRGQDDEGQPADPLSLADRAQPPRVGAGIVARARAVRGTSGRAHGCPPAGSLGGSFSAARSLALSARGLAAISSGPGVSGRRVRMATRGAMAARPPAGTGGARTGKVSSRPVAAATKVRLTMRSSSEWYDSTTTRPPGDSRSIACGRESASALSSPLTSMRNAWKTRRAGCGPVRRAAAGMAALTRSTSSPVVRTGPRRRASSTKRAILEAKRSSP